MLYYFFFGYVGFDRLLFMLYSFFGVKWVKYNDRVCVNRIVGEM